MTRKKVVYGSIIVNVKATEDDISGRESYLFDAFGHVANDVEEWLKGKTFGVFEFEVKEE